MVRIENIKINGNIVSCDYFPENKNEKGFVEYDIENDEIIKWKPTKENEWEAYVSHALHTIIKAIKNNSVKDVMYSHWY